MKLPFTTASWLRSSSLLFRRCSSVPIASSPSITSPVVTPLPALSVDLSLLEIRIGRIVEIARHPEATNLYVERVDVGDKVNGLRTIVSGLVNFCSEDMLLNQNVVVLCNLKPRAIKGITSNGMLLCASNQDHSKVVPLYPPAGAEIGEIITFAGYDMKPVEPGNKASKAFQKIADDFYVNDDNIATFRNIPFSTSKGNITSTLKGKIS